MRLHEAERQVFQFPFQLPDAEPVGQRRIEIEGLARVLARDVVFLAQFGKMAQRGQARSQTHQHHAQVGRHGEQHLAQRFHLGRSDLRRVLAARDFLLAEGGFVQPHDLPDAADEVGDFLAVAFFDALSRFGVERGQFEQDAGDARIGVGLERGQRHGHALGEFEGVLPCYDRFAGIDGLDVGQRREHALGVFCGKAGRDLQRRFALGDGK